MKPDGSDAEADHRLRIDELGALRASVRRVLHLRVEQARIRELRAVHGRLGRDEGAGARHLLGRLRRPAGAVARWPPAGVDVEPLGRVGRSAVPRPVEPREGAARRFATRRRVRARRSTS